MAFIQLPQGRGCGYYAYACPARQFGTQPTIRSIMLNCVLFHLQHDVDAGVGDISLRNGAVMPPHDGHQNGRRADIRPVRFDRQEDHVTIDDHDEYDRETTTALIQLFLCDPNVERILFDDKEVYSAIAGVHKSPKGNHRNHFHVEFYE